MKLLSMLLAMGLLLGIAAMTVALGVSKPTTQTAPASTSRPAPKAPSLHATLVKVDRRNLAVKVPGQKGQADKEMTVPTDDKTKFVIDYEDGTLADLKPGMTLTIAPYSGAAPIIKAHVKGLYGVAMKVEGKALVMAVKKKEATVAIDDKTRVVIEGRPAKPADLRAGMYVKVIPETGAAAKIVVVPSEAATEAAFQQAFAVGKTNLADGGTSTYFILEPGYRLLYEDGKDTLTITVLDETKMVDGVRTRIVEERETKGGKLAEVSRNYFAIDKTTGSVYYFGEAVDTYDQDGKVTGHEGSWEAGVNGARLGLAMPGKPTVGKRYYQELAAAVAMDRAEVASLTEKVTVPAGTFSNCLKTKESSALESAVGAKLYAPGVGLLKDGGFTLVKIEKAPAR